MSAPLNRRAALAGGLAALPALAGAALGATPSLTAPAAPDPIFAAIERHKEAYRAFEEAIKWTDTVAAEQEGREVTQADLDADRAASAAESDALEALLALPPVTTAGMRAALEHVSALDGGYYLDALTPALLASPLLAG